MPEKLSVLRKKAMSLPLTPGVYLMKNDDGLIIYIGKAKKLKNRVSQYFGSQNNHPPKVRRMVENVRDFDYILCDSEFEALVLECSLIKQYHPKYNILLKDDKGYQYIRVTRGEWPNLYAVKQKTEDGSDYIGPFTSSYSVTQAVERAKKIYRLPTCSKQFPRDLGKDRPCLNHHIGICSAPCAGKISAEEYREAFAGAVEYLKGSGSETVASLTAQMKEASEQLDFERAAVLRDRINAIRRVTEHQKVVAGTVPHQDVIASADNGKEICVSVLRFERGALCDSEHFFLESGEEKEELYRSFLTAYYTLRSEKIPPSIAVEVLPADAPMLEEWLSKQAGRSVRLHIPQRGDRHGLIEMARKNAGEHLLHRRENALRAAPGVEELGDLLGLKSPPYHIEAYDISNTAGSENVAAMVTFRNGRPLKRGYRYFRIKGFAGQNDTASMAEVLERRLTEYRNAADPDAAEGFGKLPDLILLDGGAGQLSAVTTVMERMGITLPVFGMVKDDHHRTRALVGAQGEIELKRLRSAFTLVSSIQEEVHRSAIGFHHRRSGKNALTSSLLEIEGIGPARVKTLLRSFGSLKAIREASVETLAAVKGVSRPAAQAVFAHFHPNEDKITGENIDKTH